MKNTVIFLMINIPIWIAIFFLGLVIVYNSIELADTPTLITIASIFAVCLLLCLYVFYYFLVPQYLGKGKYKQFAAYSLLTIFVIFPLDLLLNWLIFNNTGGTGYPSISGPFFHSSPDFTSITGVYLYIGSVVGALISGGLGSFYRFGVDWFKNEQVKKDLENKNLLSELKTLKSKLNPHLLFNTLNNIDALIQTSPEQASAALSKLSDLLRYVVYETEQEKVLIRKEIDNLQKYITLEKMRIVYPAAVQFTSKVSAETTIPPMIFFPFIENGFKHSNLNNADQHLNISIIEDEGKIVFNCSNTINEYQRNDVASGMGLKLAKKRLGLLFPGAHTLNIKEVDNTFFVHLEIQL